MDKRSNKFYLNKFISNGTISFKSEVFDDVSYGLGVFYRSHYVAAGGSVGDIILAGQSIIYYKYNKSLWAKEGVK